MTTSRIEIGPVVLLAETESPRGFFVGDLEGQVGWVTEDMQDHLTYAPKSLVAVIHTDCYRISIPVAVHRGEDPTKTVPPAVIPLTRTTDLMGWRLRYGFALILLADQPEQSIIYAVHKPIRLAKSPSIR